MDIEKSPEAQEKESRIIALQDRIKRTQATIKQLKTRMRKLKERVEGLQKGMFSQATQMQERLLSVLKEVQQLAEELRKDKRLDEDDKASLDYIYKDITKGFEGMPDAEEELRQKAEQREKAESFDPFQEFAVEPSKEAQRGIRQVYLRLSKRFHPDRAANPQEQEQYHDLQQQITDAYKRHDIHALLELEQRLSGEEEPPDSSAGTVDVMDGKIAELQHQLEQLVQQKERLSQEIKALRHSDMGEMLTHSDSLERQGSSLQESMGFQEAEGMIELLEEIRDAMIDTREKGVLSPLFESILLQASGFQELMDEFELEDMEDASLEEFFDLNESYYEPNPDPAFPEGTFVRISADKEFTYQDEQLQKRFSLKGLNGEVVEAYLEEGHSLYTILLDITSLRLLPRSYVAQNFRNFEFLQFVEEGWLAEERRRRRPKEEPWMRTIRELRYTYGLGFLPNDQQERLRSTLMAMPELDDGANWTIFLEQHLPFPVKVKTRGLELDWKAGRKGKLTDFVEYDHSYGLIVQAKVGKIEIAAPLYEFAGDESPEKNRILEDYFTWASALFPMDF